jgi:hypothetical protein
MGKKFTTGLTPPKTSFGGGYSSNGIIDPDEWADAIFGGVIPGEWLAVYMLRRFGWPNSGSDPYKNLCSWCLTTPIDGLYLEVIPYLGGRSNIHFGVRFSKDLGAELQRDPELEKHWARCEKAIRRWWDREGSDLYAFGVGEPDDVLVLEGRKTEDGILGLWKRPPKQKRQRMPAKASGFLWWITDLLEKQHTGVLPKFRRKRRGPTAIQRRARKAIETTLRDLLRPVHVRDVGFSPLGRTNEDKGRVEPFEGAGNTPEHWFSTRRDRRVPRKQAPRKARA